MSFSTLGLSEPLLRAVADEGYVTPTPIQRQAIPAVLAGGDLLAGAQTGTGKTAGFVLPMLQRLSSRHSPHRAGSRKTLRALADFKAGTIEVMVATDIAARGIDIDQLPHVVNYDLPNVPEDYIHRIGRTGRAGADGEAISLVCVDELVFLRDIERLIKRTIPREVIPGFEPDPHAVAQTVFTQRGGGQVRSQPGSSHGQAARRGAMPRAGNGEARRDAGHSRSARNSRARS
jgi:superfamily II DNA/RNA helicase